MLFDLCTKCDTRQARKPQESISLSGIMLQYKFH